jgi:glycosyltransferase involved in cell wall biosynthesis
VSKNLQIAVVWPKPRVARVSQSRQNPDRYPDFSDGLAYLNTEGIDIVVEESLGVPLNPLAHMHEFYSGLDPLRAMRLITRVRGYDAAICVGDATAFVLTWLRDALRIRLPIVIIDPALSHSYPRRRRLQDYVLPRASCVVVFSESQTEYLRTEYGSAVRTARLHHRADVDFYRPAPLKEDGRPYVFSVGNDISRDFDTLALAAEVCTTTPGFTHRFVVQTKNAVADEGGVLDIRRDTVPYAELRTLYQQASVVVLPLHDMIHPGGINTLLEAMATGRPLIVSDSRGVRDYVNDGVTMVTAPPGDANALAAAIVKLTRAAADAQRLGENARRFVVERCDNRVYARQLAEIIRQAVTRSMRS